MAPEPNDPSTSQDYGDFPDDALQDEQFEDGALPSTQLPPEATQLLAAHGIDLTSSPTQSHEERTATATKASALLAESGIQLAPIEHESLKYHLLGPSLTKAGQDTVDQKKVSEIIYEASKGSRFFKNEERKDAVLTKKITRILARKRQIERSGLGNSVKRADEYLTGLELERDLSQICVHLDCDAFYAAVEELDHPELKDVPFAVGKGVLTTCNYHARTFGCRSGMAGFVAMKLCPQLVCLPLNFDKYTAKAQEVRKIIADYDPNFESASIDEAYLNITVYCADQQREAADVVSELRQRVEEECKITVSAGIAPNARLAKIASNQNKPNGQFEVGRDRAACMSFIGRLPTRKVNGIGRVFERELDAIGIKQCADIYEHRGILSALFGEKGWHFLAAVYLGMGKTDIRPAESYERKSVGTESTFGDMQSPAELRAKLRHTAEELEKDAKRVGVKGRTLVLKIKLHSYEVFTRQMVPGKTLSGAEEMYLYGEKMLSKLEKELPDMKLRLMGLRLTHLVSTTKPDVDHFFGLSSGLRKSPKVDSDGWEVWPSEESEDPESTKDIALSDDDDDAGVPESSEIGDWISRDPATGARRHGKEKLANPRSARASLPDRDSPDRRLPCPICQRPQPADDRLLNQHIDFCLSKQTIQETVQEASPAPPEASPAPAPAALNPKRRGRPRELTGAGVKRSASGDDAGYQQKKLFFPR